MVVEAEQDPEKANPFEYAKIGFNYLSKTARECGFEIIDTYINDKINLINCVIFEW